MHGLQMCNLHSQQFLQLYAFLSWTHVCSTCVYVCLSRAHTVTEHALKLIWTPWLTVLADGIFPFLRIIYCLACYLGRSGVRSIQCLSLVVLQDNFTRLFIVSWCSRWIRNHCLTGLWLADNVVYIHVFTRYRSAFIFSCC